ncbi:tubulin-tyrosine ligase family-domain-containing protein [Chytriomyces cf. hyalinus JEL632]|nr:tubulin-tyrosine ligase family-domain-containing protein [Chytriomyces cf. hyalinus JEL632]
MDPVPRFTLPTRPSRLHRPPSPPPPRLPEPPIHERPYPHSIKLSNRATPPTSNGTLEADPPSFIESAKLLKPHLSANENDQHVRKTRRTVADGIQDTWNGTKNSMRGFSHFEVPLKPLWKHSEPIKKLTVADSRVSSSSTLMEEVDKDKELDSEDCASVPDVDDSEDSDDNDNNEELEEEDDEEEQEISDFDSNEENDDEDEEEEDGTEADSRGTSCTRQPNKPTTHKISMRESKLRKCISAKKYGIAVMLDAEQESADDEYTSSATTAVIKPAIVPGLFDDGDAVLYFPKDGETVGRIPTELKDAMKWKICKFTPKVIRTCLRRAGFKLVKGGKRWIGYWGKHYPAEKFKVVQPWQKVNHYPLSFEIGRKDKMYLNVCRMRERVKDDTMALDFLPATFFLPSQRRRLKLAFHSHPSWIIKPPASARGIGICVVNKWKDVPQRKDVIASKYIQNPYLIDKKKFDIRLYVVVTSFDPLRIYLFKEGIVRFAAEKYSTTVSKNNVRNRFVHLTNYSVSKKQKGKMGSDSSSQQPQTFPFGDERFSTADSKWSLERLQEYFTLQGIAFPKIMESIHHVIISTVISAHASNSSGTRMYAANVSSCYELFGFDVLLDSNLKPWVMEVNISPSLKASCCVDEVIKSRLAVDLFNLVGIRVKDLEESQKRRKKQTYQKPFLSIAERQKMRHFSMNSDYNLMLDLTENDLKILKESEDEFQRKGCFDRVFPTIHTFPYLKLFASTPYSDNLLLQWTRVAHENSTKAYNLLRRMPFTSMNRVNSATITTPPVASAARTAVSAKVPKKPTPAPNFARDTILSASRRSSAAPVRLVAAHPPIDAIPKQEITVLEAGSHPILFESQTPTQPPLTHERILPAYETNIPLPRSSYPQYESSSPFTHTDAHAPFPERLAMPVARSTISLQASNSNTPIMNLTTSYVMKPRKLSFKSKHVLVESGGVSEQVIRQMQQQQLQQLYQQQQLHQQQILHQQQHQQLYQQQQESDHPRFEATDFSKQYPSTNAYKAAMAIANVTAHFRALESGGHQTHFQSSSARPEFSSHASMFGREMTREEADVWAAAVVQQQQKMHSNLHFEDEGRYAPLNAVINSSLEKKSARAFSRRLLNTPARTDSSDQR